jgi:50S ribosomal protein L16 3-hydroxylase
MKHTFAKLLGGMSVERFLTDYWQKKPLLVRGAITDVAALPGREELLALAADDRLESRLISHAKGWQMRHGPFSARELQRTGKPWTVLVQSVNLISAAGDELMRRFRFIPYARLDDLMVSYATDGGGVGPHVDNYDVFLIQGMGQRRWRYGRQTDQRLIDDLPVRILRKFTPSHEALLAPGDMLYLPPDWAHDGIAVGDCMTFSVGFRAAPAQEIGEQFLSFLQDNLRLSGRYRDTDPHLQKHPAEINAAMIAQIETLLSNIRWNHAAVRDFLGASLTEPKPHVIFSPQQRPLSLQRFIVASKRHGITLDKASQLLFSGKRFYLNGERWHAPASATALLRKLADERHVAISGSVDDAAFAALHEAYCNGFLWPSATQSS